MSEEDKAESLFYYNKDRPVKTIIAGIGTMLLCLLVLLVVVLVVGSLIADPLKWLAIFCIAWLFILYAYISDKIQAWWRDDKEETMNE